MISLCQAVRPQGSWKTAFDRCQLTYENRFFRRKKLVSEAGLPFIVDMVQTTHFDHGDAFELEDGKLIEVIAKPESLLAVTGPDLPRLAWHIGNRHTPCQIETGRLLIQNDPVIAHMLTHIGATTSEVTEPFTPEGGAYGHGRTHSHDHGHTAHEHSHHDHSD